MKPLLVYSPELAEYSFGPDHPMGDGRVAATIELVHALGLAELFDWEAPPPGGEDLVLSVHTQDYLAALRRGATAPEFGIGDVDHPVAPEVTPQVAQSATRVLAGSVFAAREVYSGRRRRAVNIAGGLHHAIPAKLSGFCMFNDAAAAIQALLDEGATRVAYLDLDAHHGDGVESYFWDDPRVLTISVHESGLYLFPGTGFASDIGGPAALGTAVNIALDRGTGDAGWIQAVHGIVPMLLQAFAPEILISQHGADPHAADPLADLNLSVNALARVYHTVGTWADRYAQGRWVALGGGGYDRDATPRVWATAIAAVAGVEVDLATPLSGWRSPTLGDAGAEAALHNYRPGATVASTPSPALVATSRAVFPYWGLPAYG